MGWGADFSLWCCWHGFGLTLDAIYPIECHPGYSVQFQRSRWWHYKRVWLIWIRMIQIPPLPTPSPVIFLVLMINNNMSYMLKRKVTVFAIIWFSLVQITFKFSALRVRLRGIFLMYSSYVLASIHAGRIQRNGSLLSASHSSNSKLHAYHHIRGKC